MWSTFATVNPFRNRPWPPPLQEVRAAQSLLDLHCQSLSFIRMAPAFWHNSRRLTTALQVLVRTPVLALVLGSGLHALQHLLGLLSDHFSTTGDEAEQVVPHHRTTLVVSAPKKLMTTRQNSSLVRTHHCEVLYLSLSPSPPPKQSLYIKPCSLTSSTNTAQFKPFAGKSHKLSRLSYSVHHHKVNLFLKNVKEMRKKWKKGQNPEKKRSKDPSIFFILIISCIYLSLPFLSCTHHHYINHVVINQSCRQDTQVTCVFICVYIYIDFQCHLLS